MRIVTSTQKRTSGWTLIELIFVMTILSVLAVILYILIDPIERQARARDAGRIAAVTQLGHAIEAYYSSQNATFPDVASWAQDLLDAGELSSFPSGIAYSAYSVSPCSTYIQPAIDETFCYDFDSTHGVIIFARGEATIHNDKCSLPEVAYFAFSTADGRGGTICCDGDPSPWAAGAMTYVD